VDQPDSIGKNTPQKIESSAFERLKKLRNK